MRHFIGQLSLLHGWLPLLAQLLTAAVLFAVLASRTQRRGSAMLWGAVVGVMLAAAAYWYLGSIGVAGDPAPPQLWLWIAGAGLVSVLAACWRGVWWRRALAVVAIPLCVVCAGLSVNAWIGYLPTVHAAWSRLTLSPVPGQVDRGTVLAMQLAGVQPASGVITPVTIPVGASGFSHRTELVYLPPAWFGHDPAPQLPVVLMIGSALNTPADWVWAGHAAQTADDFAARHGGNAPVLVFADATGAFNNDTECVNGSRGNAADHLVNEVVPYIVSNFRTSADRHNWGVAGWSMGGTCALDLTVMHPETFTAFVDIAGDASPNTGDKAHSIAALFGGDSQEWSRFDPATVISRHGRYHAVAGWFDIPGGAGRRLLTATGIGSVSDSPHDGVANPEGQDVAANSLCQQASSQGIRCAVSTRPGRHDWPFAAQAFDAAFPWLAGRLGTPRALRIALPGLAPESTVTVQASAPVGTHGRR
ncbi:alpha/beta hydrolase-fold protein [Mycobacteroides abscessus subsp. abscessus]|uniref:alpha/beta hydrolase n=1 Tax=Mycobacteroides abscessus TaxID=36809 RepID=UPI000928B6DF|nr:alpha/beta hydrolase-fold protein [Mycobacteroides abscessus]MDO3092025.1 alpha/beta hydrolase-fold protein [Mycobacteroides abscessus subsp. abscessus]SHX90406.1 Endo-1,4-beta-xylanase Z precursor [Mycobacteroides abscessus subsp. abscessus]SHY32424.1 Endo-1,4-beta-xylanase Z precursor [Mycobacteroides abscessus subsp. abscessus]SIB15116.1 Endo-1,4-beta-xylanase Z precursor [Mycobacteroides abscessus subsp. abscessus]SIC38188.1 Endo-1,4-beta-xylanase Z precursor [Mycobacteroides abscessus 